MTDRPGNSAATVYQIRIKGHLDDRWADWFYDLKITHEQDGTTTLQGPLPDQTVLHTVLDRIRDINLALISVTQTESDTHDEPPVCSDGGAYAE